MSHYAGPVASPTVDSDPAVPPGVPAGTIRRLRADRSTRGPGRLTRWRRSLFGFGGLRILAAAAGGLALYAAFAPSTRWWAAIAGFALFDLAVHGRSWRSGLGLGFVFGLTFYLP